MTCLEKPIVFKDLKTATAYASKEYFKDKMPLWIVEQYILFGHSHPNILEKLMQGVKLNEEEQAVMDAGNKYKHKLYRDGDCVEEAIALVPSEDVNAEMIDELFTDAVKPEDCELVDPKDVPEPVNNKRIIEIMEEEDPDIQ